MTVQNNYDAFLAKGKKMKSLLSRLKSFGINGSKMVNANESFTKNKIDVIIDVRESTFYKSKEGFFPDQFRAIQESHGRQYFYFQALGNPYHKQLQAEVKAAQNNKKKIVELDDKAKGLYLDYLQQEAVDVKGSIRNPLAALKEVYTLINHTRDYKTLTFCFICYCNVEKPNYDEAGKCHRFWLMYALKELKLLELGSTSYFDSNEKIKKWVRKW